MVTPILILFDIQDEHTIYKILGQRPIPRTPILHKEVEFCHSATGTQCQWQSDKTQLLYAGLGF